MLMGKMILIVMMGMLMTSTEAIVCKGKEHKKCFHVVTEEQTWTKAMAYCSRRGATLASADGRNDLEDIGKKLLANDLMNAEIWLGASCEGNCAKNGSKAGWYWIANDKPVLDRGSWAVTQPDDNCLTSDYSEGHTDECKTGCQDKERVLLLKNGQFHDRSYSEKHQFVCEVCEETSQPAFKQQPPPHHHHHHHCKSFSD